MTFFNKNLSKNLILSILILAMAALAGFGLTSPAVAAYGLDQKVKQVKTADSPTVYYLDHKLGAKKAYVSAAAFLSYGNKWSDIRTISQAQLSKWPDLKLVKSTGDKNIYYIMNNQKALIKSPADLSNFGFSFSRVANIKKQDLLAYETVSYSAIGLVRAGGGSPGLATVTLDQASFRAGYLPMNSRHNLVATFDIKAGSLPLSINQIVLSLEGVFKPEVIEKIYLTNAADYTLGETDELNSNRQAMFSFGTNRLNLAAADSEKIKVYIDLKSYADFTNHSIKVSIRSAKDIVANAEISGSFPVTAGEYKFTVGTVLGQAQIDELVLNLGSKLIIGSNQQVISKFKIAETSNQENMLISKITLVNLGSARMADLANFKLKDANNNLIAQSLGMEDDKVIFNLNNYSIKKGQDRTFLLLADIVGGENKTVNFNVNNFYAVGEIYGYGLPVNQTDTSESFTVNRETLNVLSLDLNPSQRVFSQQTGVIIGNFQIRNNNQNVRLTNINLGLEKSTSAPLLTDAVYLVNYDSGEVYSVANGTRLSGAVVNLSFNDLVLPARQVLNFSLITSLPSTVQNGDKYRVVINKIVYRYENLSFFETNLSLPGNYLVVTKSSLFVYPNNDVGWDRSYIKGQKDVKIASYILEAAAGDDVIISQVSLAKSGDTSGSVLYENGFSNARLFINGTRVGNAILAPSTSCLTFDNFNLRFGAGSRAELRLIADTETGLKVSETQFKVLSIGARSAASNIPATLAGLNSESRQVFFGDNQAEVQIVNGGSFTPGNSDNNVGRFKVTNNGVEDVRLDSMNIVTTSDGFSYSLGFSDLSIIESGRLARVGAISRPVAGANIIGLGGDIVQPGQTLEFIIRVTADLTVPETGFNLYLTDVKAIGRKSGLRVIVSGDPTDRLPVNNTSLNNVAAASQTGVVKLAWPVSSRTINYAFHDPSYPFRSTAEHDGIDIDLPQGTPVKAAAAGVIVNLADNHNDQYNYVIIDHGNGIETVYGHLSEIRVAMGQTVTSGQIIGLSGGQPGSIGSGPNTNGPHLHFGVLQNGVAVDPVGLLN